MRTQGNKASGPKQPARRRSGFSLIEVMVALGILAFGLLGVTAGHLLAMRVSTTSRGATLAMDLAEQQLELFQAMSAADVLALQPAPNDPANPIDPDPSDSTTMAFTRRWIIEPNLPEPGVMRITVEVDWVNAVGTTKTTSIGSLKAS
jgi:prepilin-type N-terminal cleavage/methylation domain-containing protein